MAIDYSDALHFRLKCARLNDPNEVYIQTVDRDAYLLFCNQVLCERATMRGIAGRWERMELRPYISSNPYVFHLYSSGAAYISFDKSQNCFRQCSTGVASPAVFAFQSVESAQLTQEIADLKRQCKQQKAKLRWLRELEGQIIAQYEAAEQNSESFLSSDAITPGEWSEVKEKVTKNWGIEEAEFVYLQDRLAYVQEQFLSVTTNELHDS
mmetsp:Transcript_8771/g.15335  ORF Transcript_8771/g.15335 Transcript_8771/m.15335 type:complete len:210 (+) Transcript_8771:3-632(+)